MAPPAMPLGRPMDLRIHAPKAGKPAPQLACDRAIPASRCTCLGSEPWQLPVGSSKSFLFKILAQPPSSGRSGGSCSLRSVAGLAQTAAQPGRALALRLVLQGRASAPALCHCRAKCCWTVAMAYVHFGHALGWHASCVPVPMGARPTLARPNLAIRIMRCWGRDNSPPLEDADVLVALCLQADLESPPAEIFSRPLPTWVVVRLLSPLVLARLPAPGMAAHHAPPRPSLGAGRPACL